MSVDKPWPSEALLAGKAQRAKEGSVHLLSAKLISISLSVAVPSSASPYVVLAQCFFICHRVFFILNITVFILPLCQLLYLHSLHLNIL